VGGGGGVGGVAEEPGEGGTEIEVECGVLEWGFEEEVECVELGGGVFRDWGYQGDLQCRC